MAEMTFSIHSFLQEQTVGRIQGKTDVSLELQILQDSCGTLGGFEGGGGVFL